MEWIRAIFGPLVASWSTQFGRIPCLASGSLHSRTAGRDPRGNDVRGTLKSGTVFDLDRFEAGDFGEGNAGMLVFVDGLGRPESVAWGKVERSDLEGGGDGGKRRVLSVSAWRSTESAVRHRMVAWRLFGAGAARAPGCADDDDLCACFESRRSWGSEHGGFAWWRHGLTALLSGQAALCRWRHDANRKRSRAAPFRWRISACYATIPVPYNTPCPLRGSTYRHMAVGQPWWKAGLRQACRHIKRNVSAPRRAA